MELFMWPDLRLSDPKRRVALAVAKDGVEVWKEEHPFAE
jgi:hypothetical protein